MKPSKLEQAVIFHAEGNWKRVLGIFKHFAFGFSPEEKRAIEITQEVMSNPARKEFFAGCGIDLEKMEEEAKAAATRFIQEKTLKP